jgi:hypothetical protein
MSSRAEDGLFGALEAELKRAKQPLDCVTLFERASVREHASSVNRVSDYLGHMWRKGQLLRLPAPKNEGSRARWLYVWKPRTPVKPPTVEEALSQAIESPGSMLFTRPNIEITEEGDSVVITLPQWSITIKKRA